MIWAVIYCSLNLKIMVLIYFKVFINIMWQTVLLKIDIRIFLIPHVLFNVTWPLTQQEMESIFL